MLFQWTIEKKKKNSAVTENSVSFLISYMPMGFANGQWLLGCTSTVFHFLWTNEVFTHEELSHVVFPSKIRGEEYTTKNLNDVLGKCCWGRNLMCCMDLFVMISHQSGVLKIAVLWCIYLSCSKPRGNWMMQINAWSFCMTNLGNRQ